MAQRPTSATQAKNAAAQQPLLEKIKIGTQLYNIHDPLVDVLATNIDTQVSYLISEIDALAASKQDNITIDTTVTSESTNAVESQGIYSYVGGALSEFNGTLATVAHSGDYYDLQNLPTTYIDKDVNDLTHYYTKDEIDTNSYTKSQVWDNIKDYTYSKDEVTTKIQEVTAEVAKINSFQYQIVQELPENPGEDNLYIIYLKEQEQGAGGRSVYNEYILLKGGTEENPTYQWELIGSTDVNISGFVTDSALNQILASYVTKQNLADQLSSYVTTNNLTTLLNNSSYVSYSGLQTVLDNAAYATISYTTTELAKKQDNLEFDTAPTEDSTKMVNSGSTYAAIWATEDRLNQAIQSLDGGAVKTVNNIAPTNGNITLTKETFSYSQVTATLGTNVTDANTNQYVMVVTDNTFTAVTKVNGESV